MAHPHDKPANGAGGPPGTHDGHAGEVPGYGHGMAGAETQTPGNTASKLYAQEHGLDGHAGVVVNQSGYGTANK